MVQKVEIEVAWLPR